MSKKIIIVLATIFFALAFDIFKNSITPVFNQQIKAQDNKTYIIASIPDKDTFLSASQKEDGSYKEMTLKIGTQKKKFNWENDSNPNFAPKLKYIEQYKDGILTEDLVILLSLPGGVGIDVTEVHILNPKTLDEIEVENPIKAINNNIDMEITTEGLKVIINEVVHLIPREIIPISKFPYDKPYIGGYVVYELEEDIFKNGITLISNVGIELSMNVRMGLIKVYYTFKDNKYKITNMEFQLSYLY